MFGSNDKRFEAGEIAERFSYRVLDGVEIYEHDAFCTRKLSGLEDLLPGLIGERQAVAACPDGLATRLVVDDENGNVRAIITRTRSDIRGLNSLLGQVIKPRP